MAIGSGLANSASKAVATGTSQFGDATPWAVAKRLLNEPVSSSQPRNDQSITTTGNEPTVSLRGSVMPPLQADGTYSWTTPAAPTPAPWTLEGDALYQAALAAGKSSFSFAQAQALADKQNQETAANQQRKSLDTNATESRRRLAGNYASRGMAGGAAGALAAAEARQNAEQVAARTSITDQLTALNNQYLQNYGDSSAKGYDWTGTLAGQQYKTQAAQAAVQAQLARYGAA